MNDDMLQLRLRVSEADKRAGIGLASRLQTGKTQLLIAGKQNKAIPDCHATGFVAKSSGVSHPWDRVGARLRPANAIAMPTSQRCRVNPSRM